MFSWSLCKLLMLVGTALAALAGAEHQRHWRVARAEGLRHRLHEHLHAIPGKDRQGVAESRAPLALWFCIQDRMGLACHVVGKRRAVVWRPIVTDDADATRLALNSRSITVSLLHLIQCAWVFSEATLVLASTAEHCVSLYSSFWLVAVSFCLRFLAAAAATKPLDVRCPSKFPQTFNSSQCSHVPHLPQVWNIYVLENVGQVSFFKAFAFHACK